MDDMLRLRDYLTKSIPDLVQHEDFDETMFWFAVRVYDAPMLELIGYLQIVMSREEMDSWSSSLPHS